MSCTAEDAAFILGWDALLPVERTDGPAKALEVHAAVQKTVTGWLERCFPSACPGQIEDVWQAAALDVLEHPQRYQRAWERDGEAGLARYLSTVAWRGLRGAHRRKAYREEQGDLRLAALIPVSGGQEHYLTLRHELGPVISAAAAQFGGPCPAQLEAALLERLCGGAPDTEVAARHGLRREPLNRARRQVEAELLDGLLGACA
jgi:hypothetical protein